MTFRHERIRHRFARIERTLEETGGTGGDGTVVQQPAVANVDRSGLATEQITKLQDKSDEMLAALRAAGVIAT